MGRLSHEVGWKYQDVVSTVEARRKVKSTGFYKKKRSTEQLKEKALHSVANKIEPYQNIIDSGPIHTFSGLELRKEGGGTWPFLCRMPLISSQSTCLTLSSFECISSILECEEKYRATEGEGPPQCCKEDLSVSKDY